MERTGRSSAAGVACCWWRDFQVARTVESGKLLTWVRSLGGQARSHMNFIKSSHLIMLWDGLGNNNVLWVALRDSAGPCKTVLLPKNTTCSQRSSLKTLPMKTMAARTCSSRCLAPISYGSFWVTTEEFAIVRYKPRIFASNTAIPLAAIAALNRNEGKDGKQLGSHPARIIALSCLCSLWQRLTSR